MNNHYSDDFRKLSDFISGITIPNYMQFYGNNPQEYNLPYGKRNFIDAVAHTFPNATGSASFLSGLYALNDRNSTRTSFSHSGNNSSMWDSPPQSPERVTYSVKVFLGGVPWEMRNQETLQVFANFGASYIQRPGKEIKLSASASQGPQKAGYLYLILRDSECVVRLMNACRTETNNETTKYYYDVLSTSLTGQQRQKRVEVIPFKIAHKHCKYPQNSFSVDGEDEDRTVFLGALHGVMSAEGLGGLLNEYFGPVKYVKLDTDKFQYPTGSGRAVFQFTEDYEAAIKTERVLVNCAGHQKTIQIHPFIKTTACGRCLQETAQMLCQECREYYCPACHESSHEAFPYMNHKIYTKKRA